MSGVTACAPIVSGDRPPTAPLHTCEPPPARADRARAMRALEGGCECDARGLCTTRISAPSFLMGQRMLLPEVPAVRRSLLRDGAFWMQAGGLVDELLCVGSAPTPGAGRALAQEVLAELVALGAAPARLVAIEGPPSGEPLVRCGATRVLGVSIARWSGAEFEPVRTREDGAPPCPAPSRSALSSAR